MQSLLPVVLNSTEIDGHSVGYTDKTKYSVYEINDRTRKTIFGS